MTSVSNTNLGSRIRALREKAGLSQEDLAFRLQTTQSSIARLEKGESSPRLDTLKRLAAALDADLIELLAARSNTAPALTVSNVSRGTGYEQIAEAVSREILGETLVDTLSVERNVLLDGKATVHQADLVWTFERDGKRYTSVVECKNWTRPVTQKELLAFSAVLRDLPFPAQGVYVTRSGFQKGARKVAEANNISLYELRPPTEKDWEGRLRDIVINIRFLVPQISSISFEMDEEWATAYAKDHGNDEIVGQIAGFTNEIELTDSKGKHRYLLSDVLGKMVPTGFEPVAVTRQRHEFKEDTFIRTGSDKAPLLKLKAVSANVGLAASNETIDLRGDSIVSLVLKDIENNEEQSFDGILKPRGERINRPSRAKAQGEL